MNETLDQIIVLKTLEPFAQFKTGEVSQIREIIRNTFQPGKYLTAVEIGTWTGISACAIGLEIRELGGGVLYSVDNYSAAGVEDLAPAKDSALGILKRNIELNGLEDIIKVTQQSSDQFYSNNSNMSVDFIFVDGDHRHDQVKKDIRDYWNLLVDGGVMCGHDYDDTTFNEEHINSDFVEGKHHGVIKAVNEFFCNGEWIQRWNTLWWVKK